ncbi:hypothetical protein TNCV_4061961 [Trichonephila clavipes]|nr:hypothetical protein TNCV_4061961 [Trichonephila clavipes]
MACVPVIFGSRKSVDSSRDRTRNVELTRWSSYLTENDYFNLLTSLLRYKPCKLAHALVQTLKHHGHFLLTSSPRKAIEQPPPLPIQGEREKEDEEERRVRWRVKGRQMRAIMIYRANRPEKFVHDGESQFEGELKGCSHRCLVDENDDSHWLPKES